MLRMCDPIFSTGKCVVLGSGFCVSKGITALLEFGAYAALLIKKRKYWPKGVTGDTIDHKSHYQALHTYQLKILADIFIAQYQQYSPDLPISSDRFELFFPYPPRSVLSTEWR